MIATTNLEGSLDKALFRRFDEIIELPKPNEDEIIDLLKITFSALKLNKEINLISVHLRCKDYHMHLLLK